MCFLRERTAEVDTSESGQQRVGRKMNGVDAPVPVGHSYGGAVISNAATGAKNVRALVKAALDHS